MSTPETLRMEDIGAIFKRDDIRGIWPSQLNCQMAELIGREMAGMVLQAGETRRIVVGHDARTGSYELLCALCQGIEAAGGRVRNLGLCSSEQVYYVAGRYGEEYVAGAMVTASHNPAEYNGVKFVHAGALPFTGAELQELRRRMEATFVERECEPLGTDYADYVYGLSGFQDVPLSQEPKLKAVICGGNGVGVVAFKPLAALLERHGIVFEYLDGEPDGAFPRGVPNPLLPAYNARLGEAVRNCGADVGIGFDGDGDRAGIVDEHGEPLLSSHIIAIVGLTKLSSWRSSETPVIMRNLCCSQLLKDVFGGLERDVELVDTPVGHGQIKQLMRHGAYSGRVVVSGEHSGHYFYPEYFSVDSGILTCLYMLKHVLGLKNRGETLSGDVSSWRSRYRWSGELNYKMPSEEAVGRALSAFRSEGLSLPSRIRYEIRADEGLGLARPQVAVEGGDVAVELASSDVKIEVATGEGRGWWLVVRPSGNEPMLRLNVETWGEAAGVLEALVSHCDDVITQEDGVRS